MDNEHYISFMALHSHPIVEYIDNNYDALHTFGDDHIIWNIDEYLKNKNK